MDDFYEALLFLMMMLAFLMLRVFLGGLTYMMIRSG